MIRVNNIHLSLDYDDKSVRKAVAQQLRIEEKSIKSCKIFRRSVDARKKDSIYFLTTVDAELNINEDKVCKKCGNAQIARKYEYNQMKFGNAPPPLLSEQVRLDCLRHLFWQEAVQSQFLLKEVVMLTGELPM